MHVVTVRNSLTWAVKAHVKLAFGCDLHRRRFASAPQYDHDEVAKRLIQIAYNPYRPGASLHARARPKVVREVSENGPF